MNEREIFELAAAVGGMAAARGMLVATAESCTGGLVAGALTAVAGSSAWFVGGVVAYANAVKERLLGVDPAILATHGAVSGPCVAAMAQGVARLLGASAAVAVSGIAGPGGGTPTKPVGLVWLGWWREGAVETRSFRFAGDRAAVRRAAVRAALDGLAELLQDSR